MLVITGGGSPRASASPGSGIVVVRRDPPGDLAELFAREARVQGLDRRLVEAVAQVESAFDIAALSSKGAIGVMQLMPETARELGVDDPWDPAENVSGGTRYLRRMLDRFGGHLEHALAAYNAGPSAVERYGGIPPYRETVDYVKKVLGVYRGEVPAITPRSRERARPQSAPIRVERDAQGRLVLTTP
ncbi:MAG: lytic transglycosylase domain-containing protein [Acidobacteria bacterium]|nr:MAG: lytic transglycosylase domain-containing protein [Acidobacteriota bacterium]